MDCDFAIVIEAKEPDIPIPAENRGYRRIPCCLKPSLKPFVSSGWPRGFQAVSGVAMKMSQQSMTELFQFDEQSMRGDRIPLNTHKIPFLVLELDLLVQYEHAVHLGPGDEYELLVLVCGQMLEAFVEKQGTHRIAPDGRIRNWLCFGLDLIQSFQELVRLLKRSAKTLHVARPSVLCGLGKMLE
jgi:hypothetical protein